MLLTPTTELEAINQMLAAIGETPVNTVEDNGVVDAVIARSLLRSTARRVQTRGWHWNTDKSLVLSRSYPDKFLKVPQNTLKVDTAGPDVDVDVVLRGQRLYDRVRHSYVFERDLTVDLVSFLDFPELTEDARQFITIASVRKFQQDRIGSDTLSAFNSRDEQEAWRALIEAEAEALDLNIMQDATVAQVLWR